VYYNDNGETRQCLKIYDSWSGVTQKKGEYELGYKTGEIEAMYAGKYTFASTQELSPERLKNMPAYELKVMRNEIFARYGYKFRLGGEMDSYFKEQDWYKPQHSNVNDFLSELEKQNYHLLKVVSITRIRLFLLSLNFFHLKACKIRELAKKVAPMMADSFLS